jgi:uncharacterized membrane protein YeaQ/YmgE (transglycosylase-associated protein family)
MDDFNDLAKLLGALVFLGVLIGVGARLAMPGDQRMSALKTVLYGIAGAIIGGGLAELMDMRMMFTAAAGVLVAVLLIGALHQGGVLVPEDAVGPEEEAVGPAHQGRDLLDLVTHNTDGDLEREAAADEVEAQEAAEEVAEDAAAVETPVEDEVVVEQAVEDPEADA